MAKLKPVTPGELLLEEFLLPMGLSQYRLAKEIGVPKVCIHFFGDGRDTDPKSAAGYLQQLLDKCKEMGVGEIATVVGRYYIMDRDKRWDRVEIGMKGIVLGEGEDSDDPVKTIKERYAKDENDDGEEYRDAHYSAHRLAVGAPLAIRRRPIAGETTPK